MTELKDSGYGADWEAEGPRGNGWRRGRAVVTSAIACVGKRLLTEYAARICRGPVAKGTIYAVCILPLMPVYASA